VTAIDALDTLLLLGMQVMAAATVIAARLPCATCADASCATARA
jgi:hypothetical protein